MSIILTVFTFSIPFIAIFAAILTALKSMKKVHDPRRALKKHFIVVVSVFALMMTCSVAASALETSYTAAETAMIESVSQIGMSMLSAALAVGLGGIGGGLAIASGAPAAIGATSEDPKAFGKALIFVALGEAVALYGFVIAFVILSKVPTIVLA